MVNTFLPVPDFEESLYSLDYRRLGKQRVEAKQILMALRGEIKGWRNHPATRMWKGYEGVLCIYGITSCRIWKEKGYVDNTEPYFKKYIGLYETCIVPWWIGNETFHTSHKSNLIRKDVNRYGQMWPGVPPDLPYYWPVNPEE